MTERASAPRPKRAPPKLDLSDVEWKLGLGAALASVFTAAWFAVAQPQPAATSPDAVAAPAAVAPRAAVARAAPLATPRVSPVASGLRPTSAVTTVAVARPRRASRVRTRSS